MAKKTSSTQGVVDSITILIHGTWSRQTGFWHRPSSRFHRFLKTYYFPDVYCGEDFFDWSGEANDAARIRAAERLVNWCEDHPANEYNLISHSHGTNVANIATNFGLEKVNRMIHLSPPVWGEKENYLPNMDNISSRRIYNIYPAVDFVVSSLARAEQNFDGTVVDRYEIEMKLPTAGHWQPIRIRNWKKYDIGEIVSRTSLAEFL